MIRLAVAASLDHPVGLVPVCVELAIPRSTVYAQRAVDGFLPRRKSGPKPLVPDDDLLAAIRGVLTDPPFMGEGHRKVHTRLRYRGIHAAIEANRFEAMVPLHQACRTAFGSVGQATAGGLKLRHDNGSQFVSRAFQAELRFLGMDSSPSFVRAPEGNGCIERFWRTLKEQLLWIHTYANLEDLNQALQAPRDRYNHHWLIERHKQRPPAWVRQNLLGQGAAA